MTKEKMEFVEPKLRKMVALLGLGNRKITKVPVTNDNYMLRLFPVNGSDVFCAWEYSAWMRLACLLEDAMNANGIDGHLYVEDRHTANGVQVYIMY